MTRRSVCFLRKEESGFLLVERDSDVGANPSPTVSQICFDSSQEQPWGELHLLYSSGIKNSRLIADYKKLLRCIFISL